MGSKSTDSNRAIAAWEKHTGKKLPKGFVVHHRDGNPENDALSNLKLISRAQHNKLTKKGKSWKDWEHETKNKPNKPIEQRKYRGK